MNLLLCCCIWYWENFGHDWKLWVVVFYPTNSLRQTRQTGKLWGAKSIGGSMSTVSPERILRVDTRKRPTLSFRATLKALHDDSVDTRKKYCLVQKFGIMCVLSRGNWITKVCYLCNEWSFQKLIIDGHSFFWCFPLQHEYIHSFSKLSVDVF